MDTTLGETTAATADQLGAEVLVCGTGDEEVVALAEVWATEASGTSLCVTA
jgi:hypothetical protein